MKKKNNTLEILAFICIIVIGTLIFFGLKYKSSWKELYNPTLTVAQVTEAETETQETHHATGSTTRISEATQRVDTASATVEAEPELEKKSETVTVVLRSGRTITGRVESRNDTLVTLQTEAGVTNITWRAMSTNSFSLLRPELYRKLLARLLSRQKNKEEEMLRKGYIQYKGEWLTKKELLAKKYRFSNQRVATTVRSGQFKQAEKGPGGSSRMNRKERGVLMISFRGLDPEQGYAMKAEGCQFLKYRKWRTHGGGSEFASNTVNKTETMHGKSEYTFEYKFPEYNQYKGSARSSVRYGYESKDFMVKVWLDGDLIYDKPKGMFGDYLIIDSF